MSTTTFISIEIETAVLGQPRASERDQLEQGVTRKLQAVKRREVNDQLGRQVQHIMIPLSQSAPERIQNHHLGPQMARGAGAEAALHRARISTTLIISTPRQFKHEQVEQAVTGTAWLHEQARLQRTEAATSTIPGNGNMGSALQAQEDEDADLHLWCGMGDMIITRRCVCRYCKQFENIHDSAYKC